MLHVTNGDIARGLLSKVFEGEILPWRDVLHEGPVRAGLSLEALSGERARFIAEAGWGNLPEVEKSFMERDAALRIAPTHDEIVLWFEHDLYDQLQLLQLLAFFYARPHPRLSLVCEAEYVGTMKPDRMRELFALRRPVSDAQLAEARNAWAAFTGPDPSRIPMQSVELRFLGAALRRQLEEYPWTTDGLSRLERRVLDLLEPGPLPWPRAFARIDEDPVFLGDLVFCWHLERMARDGLVERRGELWSLKSRERARREPRWLGGVRVDERCPWRWDPVAEKLIS